MSKKYGIFGGTFNPPHIGHLEIAREAAQRFGLDRVFFVPSFIPPHKDPRGVIDSAHREKMTALLIEKNPDFTISDYEISKKTVSYSIDTIRHFETEFPGAKFYFIIGSDAFYYIDTWKEYAKVLELIEFIIYERRGFPRAMIEKKFPGAGNINWIENRYINLSSSDIRKKAVSEGFREDVGSAVADYIKKHGLYRE